MAKKKGGYRLAASKRPGRCRERKKRKMRVFMIGLEGKGGPVPNKKKRLCHRENFRGKKERKGFQRHQGEMQAEEESPSVRGGQKKKILGKRDLREKKNAVNGQSQGKKDGSAGKEVWRGRKKPRPASDEQKCAGGEGIGSTSKKGDCPPGERNVGGEAWS